MRSQRLSNSAASLVVNNDLPKPAMDDCEARDQERPIVRDIRRYFCEFCGICRSKKALISSHILAEHKDEMEKKSEEDDMTEGVKGSNTCEKCGLTFKKPAYLKQHMQSHSLERPYVCPVDDCQSSYRRKDHLNRHLLSHEGKLFKCPIENCNSKFSVQGNIKRHLKERHDVKEHRDDDHLSSPKQHVCPEVGCGKVFKFASCLQKHEDSHVKLDSIEALCAEPGCMKMFSNDQCLREHIQSCHQHITCEICGAKHLRKNIKRHLRTHEEKEGPAESFKCNYKGCDHTFTTKSNLNQHVKAAHLELKPFACGFTGCGMRFAYKHVRDNHEKTGRHVHTLGDFEESDEQFRSRPRGGRKRKYPSVEMLVRKRVCPPNGLDSYTDYLSKFLPDD